MLGSAVEKGFKGYEIIGTDKEEFDVRVHKNMLRHHRNPDYILHLAADTDLEFCETYPNHAYHTNTIGTIHMTELARSLDIPIIYISTAGVFGGDDRPYYDENSVPNPVNTYGRSKYYGELAVRAYEKHYIFRLSWAFGGGTRDRKFVWNICNQIWNRVTTLYAVNDKSGSPNYTHDVVKVIKEFIEERPYGLYHIPTGECTRYDVAKEIVKILDVGVYVRSISSSDMPQYTTTRPKCEVLKSVKDVNVRGWKPALKEYLENTNNKHKP